jgi:hypothetical protein
MNHESTMNEKEGRAMKETEPDMKGLLDVTYLIVCESCRKVKWCNKSRIHHLIEICLFVEVI